MKEITINNHLKIPSPLQVKGNQATQEQEGSFGEMLSGAIGDTARLHREADKAIGDLATGNNKDIHHTMIALEKADISFKLMMQVRNKLIEAYREIMRMPV